MSTERWTVARTDGRLLMGNGVVALEVHPWTQTEAAKEIRNKLNTHANLLAACEVDRRRELLGCNKTSVTPEQAEQWVKDHQDGAR